MYIDQGRVHPLLGGGDAQQTIVPHEVHHNLTCCGIPEYVPDGVYLQMVPPVYQNNRIPVPES